jgi:hypothetical protein
MSFTRDGILRWQRIENFVGGELAVARGLLYPEKSNTAYATSTGAPFTVGGLPTGVFGRIVATSDRVIPSPSEGQTFLTGIQLEASGPRYSAVWRHEEPEGYASTQIRLATWYDAVTRKTDTVALTFAYRGGVPNLVALRARHGHEMWSCPLNYPSRSAPQMMEVANRTLAVMDGSDTCGTCDPPFANSYASFSTFQLPGLGIADEPWVGTFGGAGHDHLEDARQPNPTQPVIP